jgi:hypothetical protein
MSHAETVDETNRLAATPSTLFLILRIHFFLTR